MSKFSSSLCLYQRCPMGHSGSYDLENPSEELPKDVSAMRRRQTRHQHRSLTTFSFRNKSNT